MLKDMITDFLKNLFAGKIPFTLSWTWTFNALGIKDRCPHCKSVWVCWNWIHSRGNEAQPDAVEAWYHECHDCDACFETKNKITRGIPYRLLMWYGKWKWRK